MAEISIAKTLIAKRREKGVTQEDLAHFIGVSKSSVSKWETGQSYPDITFLPRLAAYFRISIDDLMGYEPQMTDEDISKLYEELAVEFASKPFDEVLNRCRDLTRDYFSCFPLLYQIGLLLLNYGWTSKDEEQKLSTIAEAKELFVRVKTYCDDLVLKHLASHGEVTSEMMLGNASAVIDLLEGIASKRGPSPSNEVFLSQAYQMMGKVEDAKAVSQYGVYMNVMWFVEPIPPYLALFADEQKHFEEMCRRILAFIDIFQMKTLAPASILPIYLSAAYGYMKTENPEQALDMLEEYTEIATSGIFPLELVKRDAFFSRIDDSQEERTFGFADLPRDEVSIRRSIIDLVSEEPLFAPIHEHPRFAEIINKLKNLEVCYE